MADMQHDPSGRLSSRRHGRRDDRGDGQTQDRSRVPRPAVEFLRRAFEQSGALVAECRHRRLDAAAATADSGGVTMRSLLFVPGDDDKKLAKALESDADALIVDLEDSVAAARKPAARAAAAAFVAEARRLATRPRLYVRVNPFASGLTAADLDAAIPAAPDGVVLPKCLGGADVQRLGANLAVREAEHGLADGSTRIIAIATESARALFGFASYRGASDRLEGLAWGGEDLVGRPRRRDEPPARRRLCRALRAGADADAGRRGRRRNARRSTPSMPTFAISTACAPKRSPPAATASSPRWRSIRRRFRSSTKSFSVSPEAIARARAIVAAFEAAPGAGVVALDGEMLDLPHLKRAKRLLDSA